MSPPPLAPIPVAVEVALERASACQAETPTGGAPSELSSCAWELGVRMGHADPADREAVLGREAAAPTERVWPPRDAARRIVWHALNHAWEIGDRSG